MSVTVRVIDKGRWHVDLAVVDPIFGDASKIASRLRGDGFNARVRDGIVVVDATGATPAQRDLLLEGPP